MIPFLDGAIFTTPSPPLEILERRPSGEPSGPPLLFLHGAHAGAWCWAEYFLPYFADRGYHALAVSLRGHGRSKGRDRLHQYGLAEYVEDLRGVVEGLDCAPVVIGHSMGGMIIQRYLERWGLPGAVLMASVPPTGLGMSTLRLMASDPLLFAQITLWHTGGSRLLNFDVARRAIFSDDLPNSKLIDYGRRMQAESQRAIWEMTWTGLPRLWRVQRCAMLVLGAEKDALFSVGEIKATARTYQADAKVFPGMAHAMMLERHWKRVADAIIRWLRSRNL